MTKRYVTTISFLTSEQDLIASTASLPSGHLGDLPYLSLFILLRYSQKKTRVFFRLSFDIAQVVP